MNEDVHGRGSACLAVGLGLFAACPSGASHDEPDAATDANSESGMADAESGTDGTGANGDGDEGGATEGSEPADACASLVFDNRIDEAACPHIQGQGVELEPADAVEFCRRAFIDLRGISPTAIDYELACKGRAPEEIVDAFLSGDAYVQLSQRMWADAFHMNAAVTYYGYIAELDALAGQLHRGELSLPAFVERSATHPGFLGRWDGLDLVGFSFLTVLSRDANAAERFELEPLWHMWGERPMEDPFHSGTQRVVLDTRACMAPNEADCHSDFWGDHTLIVSPPVPDDMDPAGPNVLDASLLTEEQWHAVRLPGRLLADQAGTYAAYVDQALQRYLGYDLGTQIPPVRQALVDLLIAEDGNVVAVDREIITSSLYTATHLWQEPAKNNPEDWNPPYWHGPVKQMDAETWLASAQNLVGLPVGSCDHRYPEVQSGPSGFHPHRYPSIDGITPAYDFRDDARLLGGCPDRIEQFRETRAGLIAALTQATLTKDLCEVATEQSPIYPAQFIDDPDDKSQQALATAAEQIYAAAMIRPLPPGAAQALETGVEGCRDTTACLPTDFAYHTCRLVLKSADFLFY